MAFGDADLDVFTSDFGVPVNFAGAPVGLQGNLDVADEIVAARDRFPGMIGTMQVVLIKASAGAGLHIGDAITVDGQNYKVAHHARIDDSAFLRVYLEDV